MKPARDENAPAWQVVRVGEIAESIQYGHTASAVAGTQGPRFLRITDIQNGKVDWGAVPSCDIPSNEVGKYRLSDGDIVFARTGATTGKSFLIRDCPEAIFASYLIRVRLKPNASARYVYAFFQSPAYWHQIEASKRGIGQPNVNGRVLAQLELPLPPILEQQRIVAEIEKQLTRLDAGVAALRRLQANLKRYRAAVLKAACEGRLVATEAELARREGRSYESGDQLLGHICQERRAMWTRYELRRAGHTTYRQPQLRDVATPAAIPEGWTYCTIETLLREPLRNGHSAKASKDGHGLRAFTLSAVTEGNFSERNTKLTVASSEKVADLWAEPGDIYIERSNTPELVGIARLYKGPALFAFIPDLLIRIRLLGGVLPAYAESCLLSESVRAHVRSKAKGIAGSMPKIDQSVVERIPFPLPPLAEQQRIVAEVERRLSVVEELEATVAANLQRAARLRQAVLQRAFSGRLVPPVDG